MQAVPHSDETSPGVLSSLANIAGSSLTSAPLAELSVKTNPAERLERDRGRLRSISFRLSRMFRAPSEARSDCELLFRQRQPSAAPAHEQVAEANGYRLFGGSVFATPLRRSPLLRNVQRST